MTNLQSSVLAIMFPKHVNIQNYMRVGPLGQIGVISVHLVELSCTILMTIYWWKFSLVVYGVIHTHTCSTSFIMQWQFFEMFGYVFPWSIFTPCLSLVYSLRIVRELWETFQQGAFFTLVYISKALKMVMEKILISQYWASYIWTH